MKDNRVTKFNEIDHFALHSRTANRLEQYGAKNQFVASVIIVCLRIPFLFTYTLK